MCAKITDHVTGLERLDNLIAIGMGVGDLAAAQSGVARTGQRETKLAAALLHPFDEELAEPQRLLPKLGHVCTAQQIDSDFEADKPEHRWGPAQKAGDPLGRSIILFEGKGAGVAEPAR